jgi:uncharacterized protein YaiE (UPF0345 family)
MNEKERNELIDELIDGSISEANFLRLEAEMRVDPEVRLAYYHRVKLHHALSIESEKVLAPSTRTPVFFFSKPFRLLGVVAAIALFSLVGITGWILSKTFSNEVPAAEPSASGFAILADYADATWLDRSPLQRGDLLPQGLLKLQSGIAQLEFFSGVTVIIEGESEFEVHSPMEMTVSKGSVRALVPDAARGFKVLTSRGTVVDLGTEFSLNVDAQGAEMHVLQGEIEWHPIADDKQLLKNGQSIRWTEDGESAVSYNTASIDSVGDFEERFVSQRVERETVWRSRSEMLRKDPRVLAFYPVIESNDSSRRLTDDSRNELSGTIVRARRVADRWGRTGSALNFSPAGSRVRVSIPGEYGSLTFYCWARIDSLDRYYNSLFLTDGHELNEPHWQILGDGRLFFSVKRRDRTEALADKHIAYSPPFWDPSQSGKWFQIATVYDIDSHTTTHYINGRAISRDNISDDYRVDTVKIGAASIGNWNEPTRQDPNFALRNLNGAIDEFTIFTEALSAEEILSLYEIGRP